MCDYVISRPNVNTVRNCTEFPLWTKQDGLLSPHCSWWSVNINPENSAKDHQRVRERRLVRDIRTGGDGRSYNHLQPRKVAETQRVLEPRTSSGTRTGEAGPRCRPDASPAISAVGSPAVLARRTDQRPADQRPGKVGVVCLGSGGRRALPIAQAGIWNCVGPHMCPAWAARLPPARFYPWENVHSLSALLTSASRGPSRF